MGTLDRLSIILMSMAACMSISVFFYAPYFFYTHGGIVFLIPYLSLLLLLGLPLLSFEQVLGSGLKPFLTPIFTRYPYSLKIGLTLLFIMAFLFLIPHAIYASWALVMFLASFGERWISNPESFFYNNVLQQTDAFTTLGSISLPILLGLLLTWLFVFLLTWKGIAYFRNKAGYFFFIPFVLLITVISLTLRPQLFTTLSTFLIIDFSALTSLQAWSDALVLSLLSLLGGFVVHAFLSSTAKKGHSLVVSYAIISLITLFSLTTFYFSFVVLSLLPEGTLSISPGPEFLFVTITSALALHTHAQLMSGLYFATLALLTTGTLATISVFFTHFLEKLFALKRILAAALITLVGLAGGTVFTSGGGYYFMTFIETSFRIFGFLMIALAELLFFGWLWKKKILKENLSGYTLFSVRILVPFFIILSFSFTMYKLLVV